MRQCFECELDFLGVLFSKFKKEVLVSLAHDGVEDSSNLGFIIDSLHVDFALDEAVLVDQVLPKIEVDSVDKANVWEFAEL